MKEHALQSNNTHFVIVGAGAAGTAAAKCLTSAGLASRTLLLEKHTEPGGSAGYFSRGQPKRTFDAGATQLIECETGQIQHSLFVLSPAADQPSARDIFEKIPTITQHWHGTDKKVILHSNGRVEWAGPNPASASDTQDIRRLEKFLARSLADAEWMWNLLAEIPRFPIQERADVVRALHLFRRVPFKKKLLFPFLFVMSCKHMMWLNGIRRGGLAFDVVSGLLIDTTQNTPDKSPWLAAAMGLSILQRGIYRCKRGMRSYFRPLLRSFEEHGGTYKPHHELRKVETTDAGFRLHIEDQHTHEVHAVDFSGSLVLNMTLWNIVENLFSESDPIRKTPVFRRWQRITRREDGWGAFALYALVKDNPDWPEEPHYHQIFSSKDEPEDLHSSLYVSIPGRSDPAQPAGHRVLTATLHVDAKPIDDTTRQLWQAALVARIEAQLNCQLLHVESAVPDTFSRYTGRSGGRVGGFPLRHGNFLFLSAPALLNHPTQENCRLIVVGDTVFPGQGVVACSVSGIIAFERATKLTFRNILANSMQQQATQ